MTLQTVSLYFGSTVGKISDQVHSRSGMTGTEASTDVTFWQRPDDFIEKTGAQARFQQFLADRA
jgi:hypothetical protein